MTAKERKQACRMRICAIIKLITVLFAIGIIFESVSGASDSTTLFYFNPDSPQSNLSRLKREMDNFFSKAGIPVSFQPFAHLVDLEKQLEKKPPAFLFVPQWYLERYGLKLRLHPLLIPVRNGKTAYCKVLLGTNRSDLNLARTTNTSVAMTSMGPDGEAVLNTVLFSPRGVATGKINTIIVPKDSDALFALALGQVDMALVVKENMDLIAKINPNIIREVHPFLESDPIPMPVLCFTEGVASASDVQELKSLLLKGKTDERQSIIMEMLQINGWQAAKN